VDFSVTRADQPIYSRAKIYSNTADLPQGNDWAKFDNGQFLRFGSVNLAELRHIYTYEDQKFTF
jgi:hypothetical protein